MPPHERQEHSEESSLLHNLAPLQIDKGPSDLKIGIIGAGVAGIVSARVLKGQGFANVTVFEAGKSVSGVWSSGYPNAGIQTPGKLYEFPDKELSAPKDYKSGPEIQKYCEDYCKEHHLNGSIKLNTKVTSIVSAPSPEKGGKMWTLTMSNPDGTTSAETFDFCLLATGIYSPNLKFIPTVDGIEHFKGRICHSQDSAAPDGSSRQGKKVIVVGFGKSAQDNAMNAYKDTGVAPTLLFRRAHWCVPRNVLGLIPMEWLIYSRFGQGTLPKWQECGPVEAVFQSILYPLIYGYWRIVEVLFSAQLGLYGSARHLRPTLAIEKDMYCGHGIICHPDMFSMVHKGKIDAVQGSIKCILPSGRVQLNDGTEVDADEIVFATGFQRTYDFLPAEMLAKKEADGFYAYRNMILPGVPNIAFLNSNVTTFSNITTPGLQAAWIAELLKGEISLPSDMTERVEADKKWRREQLEHAGGDRAYLIQLHQIRYWDSLLRDMGADVKRKRSMIPPLAALKTFFAPVQSADYKDIVTGDYKTNEKSYAKGYTPSYWMEWSMLCATVGVAYYAFSK